MANWENAYKSFPWYTQDRHYTWNCFKEGDLPRTPITGGPLTKTGTCEAIAVMVVFFENSEQVRNGIFKVLRSAGGKPANANACKQSQSSLRRMARTLPKESYLQVKNELIALCEELLDENQENNSKEVLAPKEKRGFWNLLKRLFFRII